MIGFFKRVFFCKKQSINDVEFIAIGGLECPECMNDGLFKTSFGYRCEECLATFDENKNVITILV